MSRVIKATAALFAVIMLMTASAGAVGTIGAERLFGFVLPLASGEGVILRTVLRAEDAEAIDRGHFAYVVSAQQKLNMDTGRYYATLTLINETGAFAVDTVEDVENYNFMPVLEDEKIGRISSLEGKFIQFDMRKTDVIQKLEPRRSAVSTSFSTKDGFYLVNVITERNGTISFYDTDGEVTVGEPAQSCSYHDDGYAVIGIDGDEYTGETLSKISSKAESLPAGIGNAVIQMSEGEVVRVFSFASGFEV